MPLRLVILLVIVIAIPALAYVVGPSLQERMDSASLYSGGTAYPASELSFDFQPTKPDFSGLPQIPNVQIVDFDQDGTNELLACDALGSQVLLLKRQTDGSWDEFFRCHLGP